MPEIKEQQTGLWVAVGIAILLMAVNFLLLGLPGIPVFKAGDQLALLFLERLQGDYYWPIGYCMSFLWPPGIPVAYFVATRFSKPKPWSSEHVPLRIFIFFGFLYGWITALSTMFHLFPP